MAWRPMTSMKWLVIYNLIHISTKFQLKFYPTHIWIKSWQLMYEYHKCIAMSLCVTFDKIATFPVWNSYRAHNFVGRWIRWLCSFHVVALLVCSRFGLWTFRFVAVSVCDRFGLAIPLCSRVGLWLLGFGRSGLWPLWPESIWTNADILSVTPQGTFFNEILFLVYEMAAILSRGRRVYMQDRTDATQCVTQDPVFYFQGQILSMENTWEPIY